MKLFGEPKHPDGPRGFFNELKQLCDKYGANISGSEFGVHFVIKGSGLWHNEDFDGNTKQIDELELD